MEGDPVGGQAGGEAESGKASCSGSCVIDAARYLECHCLSYVFGWREEEACSGLFGLVSVLYLEGFA